MAEERLQKIYEIKIDVDEAIKGISNLNIAIEDQKKLQQELKKQIKELTETEGANSDAVNELQNAYVMSQQKVKDYQSQVATLSKTVQNQLKIDRESEGSMKALRAQLSNLTNEYDSLSEAERNAAKGQELKDKINAVTDELKGAEEATQRYYRNVGNYENAIKNSLGLNSKFGQTLQNVAEVTRNGVGPALKETATATANVGKQMLKLLANPIVAIIAAIAAAIMLVVKGIKSSEENTAKLKTITAAFKPVLDVVTKALQWFADQMLNVVGWIGKAVGGFTRLLEKLPIVGDEMKKINEESARYVQLEKDKQKLIERNRKLIVDESAAELQVSELRVKAKEKELYTDEERLKFVQEANEIERKIAKEKKAIAEENLRILKEQTKATQNTAEINDEIARAEAEVNRATIEYNTKRRELLEQENTIKNEILAKDKAIADEAEKQKEKKIKQDQEYNKMLEDAIRETEDMLIELISDSAIKEEKLERTRYERQVKAIKDKQSLYTEDQAIYQEYAKQLELAAKQHSANMQNISMEQRMKEADERALEWENRITEARQNGEDYKALTLEMLESQLSEIYQLQGESDEEYKARQLALKDEIIEIKQEQADKEKQIEREKIQAISGFLGNLSSVLEATAGDNKKRLKAAKVAALAEVMLNQGIAISSAVASQGPGDPYTYVFRVAAAVAAAIAAIVPAIQSVNSVKLATGGRVRGAGTSTSDSIPAMLSNGEFVVNARATSMFPELLEAINNIGLGIGAPARMEMVSNERQQRQQSENLVKALEAMPAPVVSVKEITRVTARVRALENLSKI